MEFTDLGIKTSYVGKGESILKEFLLPTISYAKKYDRITGYYTIESLLAISHGIEALFNNRGKMRLIVGIHSVPKELIEAHLPDEAVKRQASVLGDEIRNRIITISDALEKQRIATLAWMIEDGLLEVKAAYVEEGIFHPKTLIFEDEKGNRVAAVGSSNETGNGLGGNYEQLLVVKSWNDIHAVETQEQFFDMLWNNNACDAVLVDITEDTKGIIDSALGKDYPKPEVFRSGKKCNNLIKEMACMPANFFVSGDIPALYMHQERAVLDALSRWPVRVLFSDEVGLGKTFEAAATLQYMVKYCSIKRALILTPKSVLSQWQDELSEHFGIDAWVFDSTRQEYISSSGKRKKLYGENPLGINSPDLILMSAQYARGSGKRGSIFEREDTILPELLILDEAHSARVSIDFGGKKKATRMYKIIEQVAPKIPHLILATATPMQKNPEEYHAMLKLLGLPKLWQKSRNYMASLKLISSLNPPSVTDAASGASLLHSTIKVMKPSLNLLTIEEAKLIEQLSSDGLDEYDRGKIVVDNWDVFKPLFITLHPAKLLTVRNTRRSLEQVGYLFPKRNLKEVEVGIPDRVQLFYSKVNDYLSNECFLIEEALFPDRKINIGFVRVNYQQRVASSLYSCKESLCRRYQKALDAYENFNSNMANGVHIDGFSIDEIIDAIEDDELLMSDNDTFDSLEPHETDAVELLRVISLECAALSSLIKEVKSLIDCYGDIKIKKSISIVNDNLRQGESVLVFSRYTDTVNALIKEFDANNKTSRYSYGVYTGDTALLVEDENIINCDKNTIKEALFSKRIKVVFCSDAASEGLNLQAARILINVDVPWTPSRLEQRIGRIARLGQESSEVDIYNVWYPNSIEARMYHRIQKRLDASNLAIGEFPDIVAEKIKESVLTGMDDNKGLEKLLDFRNSQQVKALEKLWFVAERKDTSTNNIRRQLEQLCKETLKLISETDNLSTFELPNGDTFTITSAPGRAESVSLKVLPNRLGELHCNNIFVLLDEMGNNAAFVDICHPSNIVMNETALNILLNLDVRYTDLDKKPNTLAEMNRLDLRFAIESEVSNPPDFWIKCGGELE